MKFFIFFFALLYASIELALGETLVFSAIENSENSNISEQVLREAYRELGKEIKVLHFPGKRALQMSNLGRVDGELFRIGGLSEDFPNLLQLPTCINLLEGVHVSAYNNYDIKSWEDLEPFIVGVQRGIKFAERGVASVENLRVLTVNHNRQLGSALRNERIQVAVLARLNAIKLLQADPTGTLVVSGTPIVQHKLFHYLNRKHADLAKEIDRVLEKMASTGRIEEIREHYITYQLHKIR